MGLGGLVLDFEEVDFRFFGEDYGVLDFEGGGGGVSDSVHIILTLVLDLDFGGKMVLVGFWSWGTIVNARNEGS